MTSQSQSPLMTSLQSVISLAERAALSSEAAMRAAILASRHANTALAAAKLALREVEISETRPGPGQTTGETDIDHCNGRAAIGGLEPLVIDSPDTTEATEGDLRTVGEAAAVIDSSDSQINPVVCSFCQEKSCPQGKPVTHFRESYVGKRVRLIGSNWTEDMKNRVGVVEGFEEGFLRLKWFGAGKVKKFWLILARGNAAEFQFQFCCDLHPLQPPSETSRTPSVYSIPSIPDSKDVSSMSPDSCCNKKDCRGGPYLTHYEESYVGRQVRYCGVRGVLNNLSEEKKKRVGIIEGFEKSYLKLKWKGENTVKKFILVNPGPDYQFRFTCSDEEPPSHQINKLSQSVTVSVCQYCKMTPCSHGKKIDSDQLKKSLIGCSVKYCGTAWSREKRNTVGVVADISDGKIHIKWAGKTKQKVYPIFRKTPENKVEVSFQLYCRASYECSNCKAWPCLHWTDYEEFKDGDQGLTVEYVGPDKSIRNWVGVVEGTHQSSVVLTWRKNKKNSRYKLRDNTGRSLFRISCDNPGSNEGNEEEPRLEDERFRTDQDDKENSEEQLILLSDPKAEILDVDMDPDSDSETDNDICTHCGLNNSKCLDGKPVTYYREQNIDKRIKYVGSFDPHLQGRIGVIKGNMNGCIAIVWLGETQQTLYPLLIPKTDQGGTVDYHQQPVVEYQFKFCCHLGETSNSTHQQNSESDMRWFLLKLEMYRALPLLADLDTGEERCVNCGAGLARCLHGRYLLNCEDLKVGACLEFVGQIENLQGQAGIVSDVKKGYFKIHWTNQESKSSKAWRVTCPDGAGSFLLQFKFQCVVPPDTTECLSNEFPSDKVEQEQENTGNHCLTS